MGKTTLVSCILIEPLSCMSNTTHNTQVVTFIHFIKDYVVISKEATDLLDKTIFGDYIYFYWKEREKSMMWMVYASIPSSNPIDVNGTKY